MLVVRWVVLAVLAMPSVARADNQFFTAAFIQARSGPTGLTGWLDLHARRRADSTLAIIRPAIGWTFSPALAIHAGYAYVPTLTDAGANPHEQRTWQQVILGHTIGATRLQARGRLEQRFGAGDDVQHLLRMLARGQWQPNADLALQLVVWDELFVGINDADWGPLAGYDQNRLFMGLGTDSKIKGVRVEAGYQSVHLRGDAPRVHVLGVDLYIASAP
jgi:hypothetical protein